MKSTKSKTTKNKSTNLELERQKKLKTNIVKSTPQSMADQFRRYAKTLNEISNKYASQPNDPELSYWYVTHRPILESMRGLAKKYFCKDLPELSTLPGNDYLAGTTGLADWCIKCVAILTTGEKELSMAEIVRTLIKGNRKMLVAVCIETVLEILKLQGRTSTPNSIRKEFYRQGKKLGIEHKRNRKTKDI